MTDRITSTPGHALDRVLDGYVVRIATAAGTQLDTTPEMALVFLLLWRIDADPAQRRPISVNAVAASLDRPYETMRRRIRRLADARLCDVTIRGVAVGDARSGRAAIQALEPVVLHALDGLLAAVPEEAVRGIPMPQSGGGAGEARVAVALDLLLAIAECRRAGDRDWTDTVISAAVEVGDATSPLPCGDTIHSVARRLGLPYATTWRHVRALALAGRLVETAGRYTHAPGWRRDDERLAMSASLAGRTRALLARLATAEDASSRNVA